MSMHSRTRKWCEFCAAKSRDGKWEKEETMRIRSRSRRDWNRTEARGNSRINIYSTYAVFRTFNPADLAALVVAHTLSAMKTFVRGEDRTSSRLHVLGSRILSFFCFIVFFFLQKSSNNRQYFDICKHNLMYDDIHGFGINKCNYISFFKTSMI